MSIRRSKINSLLYNDLIIWINPKNITHYVGKNIYYLNYNNKILKYLPKFKKIMESRVTKYSSFIINKNHYNIPIPIDILTKYIKVKNFIDNKYSIHESFWYKEMLFELENNNFVKHKKIVIRDKNELDIFFNEYVLDLVNSMELMGYDNKKNKQVGYVMIGEDGKLHKSNAGEHRFFVAKILGVKSFPVRVKGIHESWLKQQGIICDKKSYFEVLSLIKKLEKNNR